MTDEQRTNPFKVGGSSNVAPNDHAVGWSWSYFDRLRLKPGDTGIVTRVDKEAYLYLDDDRGAPLGVLQKGELTGWKSTAARPPSGEALLSLATRSSVLTENEMGIRVSLRRLGSVLIR